MTEKQNVETTENEKMEVAETTENAVSVVQPETAEFVVVQDEKGKFKRKAKYKDFSSITPKNREEKLWLLNLLENDEDTGHGLKDQVGKEFEVENILTRQYDKINEDTGVLEYGVLTYLITPEKVAYVTSSKGVYFSIMNIMRLFGEPNTPEWENITLRVGKEKMQNGDAIKVKMIG